MNCVFWIKYIFYKIIALKTMKILYKKHQIVYSYLLIFVDLKRTK